MADTYDITVIGSGPAGYKAAVLAALRGHQVAIIEKATWGGCCLNRGCVPKKDWYHTAQIIQASNRFEQRGISGQLSADLGLAWQHQRRTVETVRASYLNYMKRLGVDRYEGHGRLLDARTIEIDRDGIRAKISSNHVILATGSRARIPDGFTPVEQKILTTDMLFDNPVPDGKRVAILGGGVIGTEFAFILSQFDKQVAWLLGKEPIQRSAFTRQAKDALGKVLQSIPNLQLHRNSRARSARVEGDIVIVDLGDRQIEVDWLLIGAGRSPYTTDLGLEKTAVATDGNGFIQRNEFLQTAEANIYAIGDCTSPEMTANQALADARVAVNNIIDGNHLHQNPYRVPQAIYSAVEMARIGLNEDMAEDEDREPAVGFAAFETSPRALGQDDIHGFVRLIGDMDSGELLGGEIVGGDAGELIHLLSNQSDPDTALKNIAQAAFNHPARAEELLNATETMASKWGLEDFILKD